jgi:hypothetical protein
LFEAKRDTEKTSRERKQQVFKWPRELSPPIRSTNDEYRCQRLAELIGLPAHAGIGLRKKILDVVLPWAAAGIRETIQKKKEGASPKKTRFQALSRIRCPEETFLKLYPVSRGNSIRTASGTQLFDGTLVGAAPSLLS